MSVVSLEAAHGIGYGLRNAANGWTIAAAKGPTLGAVLRNPLSRHQEKAVLWMRAKEQLPGGLGGSDFDEAGNTVTRFNQARSLSSLPDVSGRPTLIVASRPVVAVYEGFGKHLQPTESAVLSIAVTGGPTLSTIKSVPIVLTSYETGVCDAQAGSKPRLALLRLGENVSKDVLTLVSVFVLRRTRAEVFTSDDQLPGIRFDEIRERFGKEDTLSYRIPDP
ncbi:hypothetical protein QBC46DRAFT_348381 [Diplogelasinospora grovesii]|uniref:Uncharacterized protein n=1 Tax=Diplogelasinospora grovesii TaxID=303347 RepID=A0AAN6RYP5_9PEZI|nr:hypothetical protein QBC46DRAFT_348381 [Diplogelasinospora grovesii]